MQELLKKCCDATIVATEQDVWISNFIRESEKLTMPAYKRMVPAMLSGKVDVANSLSYLINDVHYMGVLMYLSKYYNDPNLVGDLSKYKKCFEKRMKCLGIKSKDFLSSTNIE